MVSEPGPLWAFFCCIACFWPHIGVGERVQAARLQAFVVDGRGSEYVALLSDRLNELLEPVVNALGYELVLLEYSPQSRSGMLRLYIDLLDADDEQGIGLEDCERVSREVAALLDVEDPIPQAYQLEVSSPGSDRPLAKPAHFERFMGQQAKVQLAVPRAGRKRFAGQIVAVTPDAVSLQTELGIVDLEFSAIERARLVPDYEKRMKA